MTNDLNASVVAFEKGKFRKTFELQFERKQEILGKVGS